MFPACEQWAVKTGRAVDNPGRTGERRRDRLRSRRRFGFLSGIPYFSAAVTEPRRQLVRRSRFIMSNERIPMSREGYDKKKADLERLQKEMLEITRRVAAAREMGDLSENAEYHAAREDQGMCQAKINDLSDQLSRAYLVDRNS